MHLLMSAEAAHALLQKCSLRDSVIRPTRPGLIIIYGDSARESVRVQQLVSYPNDKHKFVDKEVQEIEC
jgi:hypothetical protein